jgi:hypothetical protein
VPHIDERKSLRRLLGIVLPPFILAFIVTLCCCIASGTGLMLFLGAVALAMVLTPPLVLGHRRSIDRLLVAASIVDGVAVVWLAAIFRSDVTFGQWLAAYVLLAACVVAAAGIADALWRVGGEMFSTAVTLLVTLAWLTWPIWLSAWIDSPAVLRAMGWLAPIHPLLAMNGLLVHLGVWGELPLMYQLTSLGQDVSYSLPPSVAPCAAAHFLIGGALMFASRAGGAGRAAVDEPDRQRR